MICLLSLVGVSASVLLLVDAESSLTFAFAINFTTDTRETNENTNMITSNFLILSLFRFNVDCTLAESFYGKNEGLFSGGGGAGGEGGSCPSVSPLPPGSCEGSVSTCWSPGQPDGGDQQNCLYLNPHHQYRGRDDDCHVRKQPLCQLYLPTTTDSSTTISTSTTPTTLPSPSPTTSPSQSSSTTSY